MDNESGWANLGKRSFFKFPFTNSATILFLHDLFDGKVWISSTNPVSYCTWIYAPTTTVVFLSQVQKSMTGDDLVLVSFFLFVCLWFLFVCLFVSSFFKFYFHYNRSIWILVGKITYTNKQTNSQTNKQTNEQTWQSII